MKFGMLLLALIIACSLAGSLIPQQRTAEEYAARYGQTAAEAIMLLGVDDVFSTPYFIALMAALCLNLTLCSLRRLPNARRAAAALEERALAGETDMPLTPAQAQRVDALLRSRRFKAQPHDGATLYTRDRLGFYGSFLTHLSILLILAVGTAAVVWADVEDRAVMPGETLTLSDGTRVTVDAFHIEDETGRLDYASVLTVQSADGARSVQKQIRVNEPLTFGSYKLYQQTYGTAGCVRVENLQNGASELMTLTEASFLTLDGVNGLFYRALYPGYIQAEDGSVTIITSTSGAYTDPVYDLLNVSGGGMTQVLAFPGDSFTVGDVRFTLMPPVSYPGLRIKHMSEPLMWLLYLTFALIVAGLYLCFFVPPVAVKVTQDGCGIFSPKAQTGLQLELEAIQKEE